MPDYICQQFMDKSKYQNMGRSAQDRGEPPPSVELGYDKDKPTIALPKVGELKMPAFDLRQAIEQRKTLRQYAQEPITKEELSSLLWCTQGVKQVIPAYGIKDNGTLRTVPSAGARHAFETLVLVNNVDGIPSGLYRFLALKHELVEITTDSDIANKLAVACLDQPQVKNGVATFFWVAVQNRMCWRYGNRGYRYMHLDAGHVCQNLYLAAEAIGCSVCAIAAFDDDQLNGVLELDGIEQFVIYVGTVGKRA